LFKRIRLAYNNLEGFCGACDYSRKFHLCYGCRGNGYTYQSSSQGVFGQDPMCFGKIAQELAQKGRLSRIMSKKHIERVLQYFRINNAKASENFWLICFIIRLWEKAVQALV